MGKRKVRFVDSCVIYESRADDCWIAHGLRTDQIGTGACVQDALVDLMKALNGLVALHNEDPSIEVFRDAPKKIQRKADSAVPLPGEIYDAAHKVVTGEWPPELVVDFKKPHQKQSLATKIDEMELVEA